MSKEYFYSDSLSVKSPVLRHSSGNGQRTLKGIRSTPELRAKVGRLPWCCHSGPFVNNPLLFMASKEFYLFTFSLEVSMALLISFSVTGRGEQNSMTQTMYLDMELP